MQMTTQQPDYYAYLLRLWRVDQVNNLSDLPVDTSLWRASLQDPHTGERVGFASLEDLFGFLQAQAGIAPESATANLGQKRRP